MDIELRLEQEKDKRIVEEVTREAFWNLHVPGCDEHFLVHNMREAKEFIRELDFVAIHNEKIVGNIVYVQSKVIDRNKEHIVLTFGPVSVLPEYQKKGIGAKLINHTIQLAKQMDYKSIIIYGVPDYYKKYGFIASKVFNITDRDGKFPAALLVLELYQNAMEGIHGIFDEGQVYRIDAKESEEFDKGFVKKEKLKTQSQEKFIETSSVYL